MAPFVVSSGLPLRFTRLYSGFFCVCSTQRPGAVVKQAWRPFFMYSFRRLNFGVTSSTSDKSSGFFAFQTSTKLLKWRRSWVKPIYCSSSGGQVPHMTTGMKGFSRGTMSNVLWAWSVFSVASIWYDAALRVVSMGTVTWRISRGASFWKGSSCLAPFTVIVTMPSSMISVLSLSMVSVTAAFFSLW